MITTSSSAHARTTLGSGLLTLLACLTCSSAQATTVVAGSVMDAVTATPIAGAALQIENGGVLLGSTRTDGDGNFRLPFEIETRPTPQNLKLAINHENYVETAEDVIVTSSRTDRPSYRVVLLPQAVANCRRPRGHTVVVGYFRPPANATAQMDLTSRIRDTLDYDVLARIQKLHVGLEQQPVFLACEQIKPQALADYTSLAKVLTADAFLSGYVAPAGLPGSNKVKVEMSIGDRFGLMVPPTHASSPNIDLDDPATARLQAAAQAAIFTALIAGYEKSGQPAECIKAANAAEQAIGILPPPLVEARKRCERATPNSGLTKGGAP
jgi:hypothetical protein